MREAGALTCAEIVELVTDYLEGALDPAARERFEAHLAGCDECGVYLDQMRLTVEVAGRLREEDLDERTKAGLLEAFADWRRRAG